MYIFIYPYMNIHINIYEYIYVLVHNYIYIHTYVYVISHIYDDALAKPPHDANLLGVWVGEYN
jgi:hypothetical protein